MLEISMRTLLLSGGAAEPLSKLYSISLCCAGGLLCEMVAPV